MRKRAEKSVLVEKSHSTVLRRFGVKRCVAWRSDPWMIVEVSSQSPVRNRPLQLLRLPQVCKATGLGRSMIYQLEGEQRFPRRVKISARAVGWVEEEVQLWLAQRVATRQTDRSLSR